MARPRKKTNTTVSAAAKETTVKAAEVKPAVKEVAEKAAEVKPAVKEAAKKVEETVEAAAKTTGTAAKKTAEEVKSVVKKAVKKTPAKKEKEPAKTTVKLQFGANAEANLTSLEDKIKAQFVADGHRAGCIKSLDIYVKPEDGKAYYVINDGKYTGDVNLF